MRISVVVPVFNVEAYLQDCVDSILAQTYTDFELILVDDGSTDKSGVLCDELQKIDPRIAVLHKTNGGLSDARNCGIELASGEYITFIDSDDFVSPDYLNVLMNLVLDFEAQAACVQTYTSGNRAGGFPENRVSDRGCMTGIEAIKNSMLRNLIGVSACGKLFKTSLFQQIRFPVGKLFEDLLTIPYVFEACSKVAYSTQKLYFYYNRPGSITHSVITKKHLAILEDTKQLIQKMDTLCPETHEAIAIRFCVESIKRVIDVLLLTKGYFKRINEICDECRQYWLEGIHSPLLPKSIKIQIAVLLKSPFIYWMLFLPYKRIKFRMENNLIADNGAES